MFDYQQKDLHRVRTGSWDITKSACDQNYSKYKVRSYKTFVEHSLKQHGFIEAINAWLASHSVLISVLCILCTASYSFNTGRMIYSKNDISNITANILTLTKQSTRMCQLIHKTMYYYNNKTEKKTISRSREVTAAQHYTVQCF